MDVIQFFVPGNPKGLKRHRTTKTGYQYDPNKADKSDFLAKAMEHRPDQPLRVPLALTLVCVFPRPKAHYRTGKHSDELRDDAPQWYGKAPDADNVVKFVGDALNGIFWHDDRLIAVATVYCVYGVTPGIAVRISEPGDTEWSRVFWLLNDVMGEVSVLK